MSAELEPERHEVTVLLGREAACELLTGRIGEWWPRGSTFSHRSLASVHLDVEDRYR